MEQGECDRRLADISREWRSLRYTGGPLRAAPGRPAEPRRGTWLMPAALAATLVVTLSVALLLPRGEPVTAWPESLRPIVSGSPLVAAPPPPALNFRVPHAPARQSCFGDGDGCDQPTG